MSDQLVGMKGSDYPKLEDFTEEQRTAFLGSTLVHAVGKLKPSDTSYTDANLMLSDLKTDQIQADWNEQDDTKVSYIKNKPEIPSIAGLATEEQLSTVSAKIENDYALKTDLPTAESLAGLGLLEDNGKLKINTDNSLTIPAVGYHADKLGVAVPVPAPNNDHSDQGKVLTVDNSDQIVWEQPSASVVISPYNGKFTTVSAVDDVSSGGYAFNLNLDDETLESAIDTENERKYVKVKNPLPSAEGARNGDVLTVTSGQVGWAPAQGGFPKLPVDYATKDYFLHINQSKGTIEWAEIPAAGS
jgi:hypothetical protein